MTTDLHVDTPHITARQQWWALTARGLGSLLRNGEVILALIAPAFLAI